MYLENMTNYGYKRIKYEMTLQPSMMFWRNNLLKYCMRLFTWNGLPESIPQHEIEVGCFIKGYHSVVKLSSGDWIASECSQFGITHYRDIFTDVNFATPLTYGKRKIGKTAVLIKNDTLFNSLLPIIDRYAILLAHADISTVCEFVNGRDVKTIEVIGESQAQGVREQRASQYNGFPDITVNQGFAVARFSDNKQRSQGEINRLLESKNTILESFFEEIGIRKASKKKERMVTDEVTSDTQLLCLNISDMLECRQTAAEEMSKLMNLNITVKCNINYNEKSMDLDDGPKIDNTTLKKDEKIETK